MDCLTIFSPFIMRLFCPPGDLVGEWMWEANGGHSRDVRLVCDDGTLACSSIVLAANKYVPALADGIKTLDRCSFCTQPTVVILPGIRYFETKYH